MKSEFEKVLEQKKIAIESLLKNSLPQEKGYQKQVFDAMEYNLLAGGKRLRPMLMLETYRFFGGNKEQIVEPFMIAIEMIHTYSLIHDDLPEMDNDDYRRGRKTTHIVYGHAMGVLAGDALLNYAYEVATGAFDRCEKDEYQYVAKALQVLARKPGVYGMLGGQVVDVEAEKNPEISMDLERILFIHQLKTGALLEASMMIGAILAHAAKEEIDVVEQVAQNIGVAFQIQDDILDITGNFDTLGKPVNSDARNEKVTYVTLQGLEESKKRVACFTKAAETKLQSLSGENPFLLELIQSLVNRDR